MGLGSWGGCASVGWLFGDGEGMGGFFGLRCCAWFERICLGVWWVGFLVVCW